MKTLIIFIVSLVATNAVLFVVSWFALGIYYSRSVWCVSKLDSDEIIEEVYAELISQKGPLYILALIGYKNKVIDRIVTLLIGGFASAIDITCYLLNNLK